MFKSLQTKIILLLVLISQVIMAQLPLREGEQELEDKKVEFGKITCKVMPVVTYHAEKPGHIEIRFKADWFKKGERLTETENQLFLYDNFEKYENYFKSKGITTEYETAVTIAIKRNSIKSINTFNNGKPVNHKLFITGFLAFNRNTDAPLVINDLEHDNNIVELRFRFVYVTVEGKKRVFRDVASENVSWKFMLPSNLETKPNCDDIYVTWDKKIGEIQNQNDIDKANSLKQQISKDADLAKCQEVRKKLLDRIDKYIDQENEIIAQNAREAKEKDVIVKNIEEPIQEEPEKKTVKTAPAKSKSIDWSKVESDYEKVLTDLKNDFANLKSNQGNIIFGLGESVKNNSRAIDAFGDKLQLIDNMPLDTIQTMKMRYEVLKQINLENNHKAESVLHDLRAFSVRIKSKSNKCKGAFIKLDKNEGLSKYKKFQQRFDDLISRVGEMSDQTESLQETIGQNNNKILNLLEYFDKEKVVVIKNIKAKYDSIFGRYLSEMLQLEKDYNELKQAFEESRFSRWYFEGTRKKYLNRANAIQNHILELQIDDSIAEAKKDNEFTVYEFDADFDNKQNFDKTLINIKPGVTYLINDIKQWPAHKFPYFYLVLIIIMATILIFGGRVYFKALKSKKTRLSTSKSSISPVKNGEKSGSGGIVITQTKNSQTKGKGLAEVRQKAGIDFLELDLSEEWDNTMVKRLYFARECIKKTYRFFEDSVKAVDTDTTANETGGYLIGRWDTHPDDPAKFDVSLEDFIEPGDDASFSRYQLNFGAKIGIKLQKILENRKQKDGKELVMTAWFHSHPGLKIFLSDFDLSVQKDFSGIEKKQRILALVIDPYTEKWDTGIFTFREDGTMNNADSSKKFFSLDEMYQWALKSRDQKIVENPVTEISDAEIPENYFSFQFSQENAGILVNRSFFSNPCILEIKRLIEDSDAPDNENKLLGFLTGKQLNGINRQFDIIFNKILPVEETVGENAQISQGNPLGCIICISSEITNIMTAISRIGPIDKNIQVILAYKSNENSFTALSRDSKGLFSELEGDSNVIDFANMIAWTRKRK